MDESNVCAYVHVLSVHRVFLFHRICKSCKARNDTVHTKPTQVCIECKEIMAEGPGVLGNRESEHELWERSMGSCPLPWG